MIFFCRRAHCTLSNIDRCDLVCLDNDAFRFPGAGSVTTVSIQSNNFVALPDQLLWNMTSMLFLYARTNLKLTGLPENFFLGQAQLVLAFFTGSRNMGQSLPDKLFKGLTGLKYFSLGNAQFRRLPSMDDFKVCSLSLSFVRVSVEFVVWSQNLQGRRVGLVLILCMGNAPRLELI